MIDGFAMTTRMKDRLGRPLPGREAQSRFAPELGYGRHYGPPLANSRHAAVLVLLFPFNGTWHMPLMLRPTHMPAHAGQISFPGGELEPDESAQTAAIREFREEFGAKLEVHEIVGELSKIYVFASDFWVTPVVAVTSDRPRFFANEHEVAAILEPSIDELSDIRHHLRRPIFRRGFELSAPGIQFGNHFIWGATAMILGEFFQVVADCRS